MDIRACIFDLDGTLLETREAIARAVNAVLETHGLPPQPAEDFAYFTGDGIDTAVRRALAAAGASEEETERIHREGIGLCRRLYREDPTYHVRPYPHIREMLEGLKSRGIRLAVLTNKPHENAGPTIRQFFGEDLFDHVQGEDGRFPKKPDPAGAAEILRIFGVKKEECLYIGDTNTDMKTAQNAGLFAVGVSWGFRPREELEKTGADAVIDDPLELLELIERRRS